MKNINIECLNIPEIKNKYDEEITIKITRRQHLNIMSCVLRCEQIIDPIFVKGVDKRVDQDYEIKEQLRELFEFLDKY